LRLKTDPPSVRDDAGSDGRFSSGQTGWREDPTGHSNGPYRIVLEGLRRWRLERGDRLIGMFETLSAAKAAAGEEERRRAKRAAVAKWLGVSLVAATVVVLLASFPKVPNPDYPPAETLAQGLTSAYRSIRSGETVAGQYQVATDGFEGGVVLRPGTDLEYNILMGESEGECYVLWWNDGDLPNGGVLAQSLECRPSTVVFGSHNSYQVFAPASDLNVANPADTEIVSDKILPSPTQFGWWVVPGIAVALLVAIMALVRVVVVLIRKEA
jgi:hypothetical protein